MSRWTQEEQDVHKKLVAEFWAKAEVQIAKGEGDEGKMRAYQFYAGIEPCCHNEDRNFNGWCQTCGDPCF